MFEELFEKVIYETLTNDQRLTSVEKEYADWKIVGLKSRVLQLGQIAAGLRRKAIEDEDKVWKDITPEHKLEYAKARVQFWTELSNYDSNNKDQMDKWNEIVQELEKQSVAETKVNEVEDEPYRGKVDLTVYLKDISIDGQKFLGGEVDEEAPKEIEIKYAIEIEHRSWGIDGINVSLKGEVEFDCILKAGDNDEYEVTVPVKIDFSKQDVKIDWLEGRVIAPAELRVTLSGEKGSIVKEVEVDFYYLKP
jgi:hypothetical protein